MLVGLIVIFALLTVTLPKSWWLLATEERDSSRYGTLWWQCTGVLTAALLLLGLLVPLNPSESTGSTRNPSPGGPGDLGSAGLILLLLGVAALASYGTLLVLLLKPPPHLRNGRTECDPMAGLQPCGCIARNGIFVAARFGL